MLLIVENQDPAIFISVHNKFIAYGPTKSLLSDPCTVILWDLVCCKYNLGLSYNLRRGQSIKTFITCVHNTPQLGHYRIGYGKLSKHWKILVCKDLDQSFAHRTIKQTPQEIYKFGKSLKFWNIPGYTPTGPMDISASLEYQYSGKKRCTIL